MFGLFNAIYWTHVKMAADSSREPLAKNFAPGETEINWDHHLVDKWWRHQKWNCIKRLGQLQNIIHLCQKWIKQAKFIVLYMLCWEYLHNLWIIDTAKYPSWRVWGFHRVEEFKISVFLSNLGKSSIIELTSSTWLLVNSDRRHYDRRNFRPISDVSLYWSKTVAF